MQPPDVGTEPGGLWDRGLGNAGFASHVGVAVRLTLLKGQSWNPGPEWGPARLAASTWPWGAQSGVVVRREPDRCGPFLC